MIYKFFDGVQKTVEKFKVVVVCCFMDTIEIFFSFLKSYY